MSRNRSLSFAALACLALSTPGTGGCGAGAGPNRPNVVLVVVDTLRADRMSLHGHDRPTTPAIDAWAVAGTVFERAWSACSWTTPSMAMLMTGRARVENSGRIAEDEATLAEVLQRAGYRTGAFVDNPLLTRAEPASSGSPDAPRAPRPGPDERREEQPGTRARATAPPGLGFDRGFEHYSLRPPPRSKAERNGRLARDVVDEGLAWAEGVRAEQDAPFFLFLHLFDPHDPYAPEGGLRFEPRSEPERRAALESALPEAERDLLDDAAYAGIERRLALYESEVLQLDRGLARLFRWLEAQGLAEDTLVVLTSDHGEGLWQRAALPGEEHKPDAFFPWLYFDHGVQLYSEQVHVPLVFVGPGVPAGQRIQADVSTLDLVPTVLRLANVGVPAELDGLDALTEARDTRDLFSFCSRGTTLTRVSPDGRWRLHWPREYRVERFDAVPELFDLNADPAELTPLPPGALGDELGREIEDYRARRAVAGRAGPRSAEQAALMRAMGYTGEGDEVPLPEDEP